MCLNTDAYLTADQGVASSIQAQSLNFMEIDREIISTAIQLPSADSFKEGCCQLQAQVCAQNTGLPLVQACPGKKVVRWTDRPDMTIAVATNKNENSALPSSQQFFSCIGWFFCIEPVRRN